MAELLLDDYPTAPPTSTSEPSIGRRAEILIQASKGWRAVDLGELWRYRELIFFLAWRDLRVRYRQTLLGILWAVIQPVFTMVIFSIIFGRLARIPSDGVPYPIFAYAALVPWQFFATSLGQASNSLVGSQHLITKVYFPRLVIPISAVLVGIVDLGFAFLVLVAMMIYFGVVPTLAVLILPFLLLLAFVTALGLGLWLSALNVQYRDVRYTIPFLTQVWLYATPVAYPSSLVDEQWRPLVGLNPMAGVVEGFRAALLGTPSPSVLLLAASSVVAVVLLVTGLYYFRRMERRFADVV